MAQEESGFSLEGEGQNEEARVFLNSTWSQTIMASRTAIPRFASQSLVPKKGRLWWSCYAQEYHDGDLETALEEEPHFVMRGVCATACSGNCFVRFAGLEKLCTRNRRSFSRTLRLGWGGRWATGKTLGPALKNSTWSNKIRFTLLTT